MFPPPFTTLDKSVVFLKLCGSESVFSKSRDKETCSTSWAEIDNGDNKENIRIEDIIFKYFFIIITHFLFIKSIVSIP